MKEKEPPGAHAIGCSNRVALLLHAVLCYTASPSRARFEILVRIKRRVLAGRKVFRKAPDWDVFLVSAKGPESSKW
jgi:hypothetical protein